VDQIIKAFLEKSREIAGPGVVEEFLKQVPVLGNLAKF
jgi:hypothetical protein